MHTSSRLKTTDFTWRRIAPAGPVDSAFPAVFPDYHPQDRIGIVSPRLEDGILHAGGLLLALTTAFYDACRVDGPGFFDYPQHLAFIGGDQTGVYTASGEILTNRDEWSAAWGWLDVWPEGNWIIVPPHPGELLERIGQLHINRLLWPEKLAHTPPGRLLPAYARSLLASRLKSVWLYDSPAPDVALHLSPVAATLMAESVARLPGSPVGANQSGALDLFRYRIVGIEAFLTEHAACFE